MSFVRKEFKDNLKLLVVSAFLGLGIGIVSVVFLMLVSKVTSLVWGALPYAPLLGIMGGLLVGLTVKRFGSVDGIGFEAVAADVKEHGIVRTLMLPRVVLNAFFGLITGASIGPEAPLMALGGFCGSFLAKRLKMAKEKVAAFTAIALGTSLGTLLESPIAGGIFMVENPPEKLQKDRRALYTLMFSIFVAACFGFGVSYLVLGDYISTMHVIPSYTQFAFVDLLYALLLGITGAFLGIVMTRFVEKSKKMGEKFHTRPVLRAAVAGFLVGCVGVFLPLVLFSGQDQLPQVVNSAASYSAFALLVLVAAKILVTGISFGGGYQGGNIFPTLFVSGVTGLFVHALLPFIPLPIAMAGIMGGMLFASFRLPLFSIFLLVVMSEATVLPFIAISVAGGMFVLLSTQKKAKT